MDFPEGVNYQWTFLQLMNGPLEIQSVLEWLRDNFITAQHPFIDTDALLQWSMQNIAILFSIVLATIPVTQSDSLRENVLMGDIKKVYFSAVVTIQQVRAITECPYPIQSYQRMAYVITPLIQMMRAAARNAAYSIWFRQTASLAAQLLIPITPHTIEPIRALGPYLDLGDCKNLVSIKRLVKACENKYVILFNPMLKGVWEEIVDSTKKQVKYMGLTISDPNIWATALWY